MKTSEPPPVFLLLGFLLLALAIAGSVAIFGRRAPHVLFFGEREVRGVPEGRVLFLRMMASLVPAGIIVERGPWSAKTVRFQILWLLAAGLYLRR